MSKYRIHAAVARHVHGGWEAWLVFPDSIRRDGYLPLDTGGQSHQTRQEAMDALTAKVKDRSDLMRRPVIEWKREDQREREARIRTGELLAPDNCEILWFDPAKHFTHCDTAFVYDGEKPTNNIATFYRYNEDGTARVWITGGIGECDMDVTNLKPHEIHKPW